MEIDREADAKDIHFEYYQSGIRCDQQGTLPGDIAFLSQHPSIHFTVEGHCDQIGSTEYNETLGSRRSGMKVASAATTPRP
jgi:peptidoglycan-associated lipoprotein